jgi:hypothetical protein
MHSKSKPNSRIIFIAPVYFNYHSLIINSLKEKGHTVDFLEDKNSGFIYTFSKKSKFLLDRYKKTYRKEIISKLNENSYDLLIVIGGKTLDVDFWEFINKNYSFKKILYQWDSFKNFDYRSMIPYFDVVKTFDSQDANLLGVSYLPLFYKSEKKKAHTEDIDLVFIGIWHSDRLDILNEIAKYAKNNNLTFCFKIYYPYYMYIYLVYIKKIISRSDFFTFKPIPLRETIDFYERAKCILDINHPGQSGLTMRTIETIGKGKKLITTNSFIKKEKFYDSQMIQVIDRVNIKIDFDFFNQKGSYKNIENLEILNWVDSLLN